MNEANLVQKFNRAFVIGQKIEYRWHKQDTYRRVIIANKAFLKNSLAVVEFENISGLNLVSLDLVKFPDTKVNPCKIIQGVDKHMNLIYKK